MIGVIGVREDGIIAFINAEAERMFGYESNEICGSKHEILFNSMNLPIVSGSSRMDRIIENIGIKKNGGKFPLEITYCGSDYCKCASRLLLLQDVSEVKLGKQRQLLQFAVTEMLTVCQSLEELVPGLLSQICEILDYNLGEFWIVDPASDSLTLLDMAFKTDHDLNLSTNNKPNKAYLEQLKEFEHESRKMTFAPGVGVPGLILQSKTVQWVPDVTKSKLFLRRLIASRAELRSAFGFPIFCDNRVIAIAIFYNHLIVEPTDNFLAVINNISDQIGHFAQRKSAEKQVAEQQLKMIHESKMAALGEIAAGIAHEINNPLSIISGSLGLLTVPGITPEQMNHKLKTIEKSVDRIGKIVSSLKKFSRSSAHKSYARYSLPQLIEESLILTKSKSKQFNTPVNFERDNDFYILCDQAEIEQVSINLINNAIDAVKPLNEKWVKITIQEENEQVILRIIDSGPGIPREVREKMFESFFTTKPVGEGTGLGLSITKKILGEHGASISVNADMPNTCFEIKFKTAAATLASKAA